MKNKKIKFESIETVFCLIYSIILYIVTYIFRDSGIFILKILISEHSYQYIIIPYLIILAILLIIKSIFRDNLRTNIISTAIILIITIISYYKYKILELPFLPNDILLIGNANQIAKFGLTVPSINIIITTTILILILVLQYIIRKKYFEKSKISLKNDLYRIPLFIVGIIIIYNICIVENRFVKLGIKNELGDNYAWMGGNAVFFMHLGDLYTKPPEGYTDEAIKTIREEYEYNHNNSINNKPNVIIIMNESFSNPNKIKNVEYSVNPIQGIMELSKEDKNCIMGEIISPVFGGGTSLPEFEFLTGLSSYFLEKQIFPYTSYIKADMNSMVRVYNNNGYETVGIHTNTKNFYNRVNVYKYLGFEKTIFEEDIKNPEIKGDYISDNEFGNQIIRAFEETDENKFIFGVTMQNHMPYIQKNYENYDIEIKADNLNEQAKTEFLNYVQGVYDGDKMYMKLVEYFRKNKKPTILVMFGDHLPPLSSDLLLNSSNTKIDYFSTPYIIWANYDIKDENILKEKIGPSTLSLDIANLAKIEIPWYMKVFKELYEKYPAISNQIVISKDNRFISKEKINDEEIVKNCSILQYDLLIKKKYIPIE